MPLAAPSGKGDTSGSNSVVCLPANLEEPVAGCTRRSEVSHSLKRVLGRDHHQDDPAKKLISTTHDSSKTLDTSTMCVSRGFTLASN